MQKVLKVIEPFFMMNEGDTLEMSKDGNSYTFSSDVENTEYNDSDMSQYSRHYTEYTISSDYAKSLIEDGYLAEVKEEQTSTPFVNVFDEIDNLIGKYKEALSEADSEMEHPAVYHEKVTVYNNLIKALTHLKNLKK